MIADYLDRDYILSETRAPELIAGQGQHPRHCQAQSRRSEVGFKKNPSTKIKSLTP